MDECKALVGGKAKIKTLKADLLTRGVDLTNVQAGPGPGMTFALSALVPPFISTSSYQGMCASSLSSSHLVGVVRSRPDCCS